MVRMGLLAAAAAFAAPAWGQTALAPVLERLEAQGYGGFEVENERGQLKVEAVKDGVERELVYDASTGKLLSDVQHPTDDSGSAVATGQYSRLYDTLTAAGYSDIKIEQQGGRIEVDATKDGVERDLTYDASTGSLISARVDDRDDDADDDRVDGDDDRDGSGDDDANDNDDRDDDGDRDDDSDGDRDHDDDSDDHGASGSGGGGSSGQGGGNDADDDHDDDDDHGGADDDDHGGDDDDHDGDDDGDHD